MTPTLLDTPKNLSNQTVSDVLVPKWIESSNEASKALQSEDTKTVWIIRKASLADSVAHQAAEFHSSKKSGYLILLLDARSALLPPLEKRFKAVAWAPRALSKEELDEVLRVSNRQDRFIGGLVDEHSKTLTLWRGNLSRVVVPFEAFPPTGNGIRPKFDKFSVTDYGRTLRFGDYESSADAVLFEFAPDFRRRLKQTRFAKEQSLGASIRRLRKQRRLTLNDFEDVDPKTLARIEHGKVQNPRSETLRQIAKKLRVPQDELGSY
jgi:DNA-binding XRE family transcriptional regulator